MNHSCRQGNSRKFIIGNCSFKTAGRIGSDTIEVNFDGIAVEPIKEIYIHTVFYYKYMTYRKFPIDIWEELCGWLDSKRKSFFLDIALKKVFEFVKHDGNLSCPLIGEYAVRIKTQSTTVLNVPSMVPSGRYRIDVNVTESDRNNVIAITSTYVSNSDNRIEQV